MIENRRARDDQTGGTEIGPVPADWTLEEFDNCIHRRRIQVGKENKRDYQPYGRFPIVDQGQNLIAGYSDDEDKVCQEELPAVIFGDHTRILKYVDFPFICGADGVKVLLPNHSKVVPKFLFFALKTLKIPSRGYNRHYRLLRETKLPLPPLPEQRRIARVLNAIQRAIAAQDDVITAARELKRSLMHRLFTYGPGRQPAGTKDTEIGEVPAHWDVVPLGEMVDVKGGKRMPKGHRYADSPTKHAYIRVVDFDNLSLDRSSVRFITPEDHQAIRRYTISAQDVYISIAGTTGVVGTVPDDLDGANLTENAAKLVIRQEDHLMKRYVVHALASDRGQMEIKQRTT